jgi:hypothetical protein
LADTDDTESPKLEGVIGVKAILGVTMETEGYIPTQEEMKTIRDELSGLIDVQTEKLQQEEDQSSREEINFLFIEVSNGPVGEDKYFGNLMDVVLTPFPTQADDEWRPLLKKYLERLEMRPTVKELRLGEYYALVIIGLDSGLGEDNVYGLFYPFMVELRQAGKI